MLYSSVNLFTIAARVALKRVADSAPTTVIVEVWRGMTGLKASELQELLGQTIKESGSLEVDIDVPHSDMGWWSNRKGVAMAYASTDPVRGPKGPGSTRYDILMRGEATIDAKNAGKEVTWALREKQATVRITHVFYSKREGSTQERKNYMENLTKGISGITKAAGTRIAASIAYAKLIRSFLP